MKNLRLILIAILCLAPFAYSEETKEKESLESLASRLKVLVETEKKDLANAFLLYGLLKSDGEKPALVFKKGEVRIVQAGYAGEFWKDGSMPNAVLYQTQIKALKEEVAVLKELNAALEKQLAAYKQQP